MNQANTITGYKQHSLQVLFDCFMEKHNIGIFRDYTHPPHSTFDICRLKIPLARRNAYKNHIVVILNQIIVWRKCKREWLVVQFLMDIMDKIIICVIMCDVFFKH